MERQTKRIEELEKHAASLLEILDHEVPERSHSGSCGPEQSCDGVCMTLAGIAATIRDARAALQSREKEEPNAR